MRGRRRMTLIAGFFVVALILAACGGDDGGDDEGDGGVTGATNGATGATEDGGGVTTEVTIEGFAFSPSTVVVSGPTEITVTNNDGAPHTFTLDDGSVDLELGAGESGTATIDVSEDTGFVCRFHPGMTGTVQVA